MRNIDCGIYTSYIYDHTMIGRYFILWDIVDPRTESNPNPNRNPQPNPNPEPNPNPNPNPNPEPNPKPDSNLEPNCGFMHYIP